MIYLTAIILGVLSSLHCVGMCGPIAIAIPSVRKNFFTILLSAISYNMGRVISYSILGLTAGVLGMGFYNSVNQRWISVVLGCVIIIWAFIPLTNPENWKILRNNYFIKTVRTKMGLLFKQKNYPSILLIGVLNGVIPCGMVYIAMVGAIASGSPLMGAGYMFLYGLGTIPLMLILLFSWEMITPKVKTRMAKLTPVFVGLIGLLLVLRGLELGIPILSPQVIPDQTGMTTCYSIGK